jgi:DNA polymerase-4
MTVQSMRTIFHIDVNSAYLSWEATRRKRDADRLSGSQNAPGGQVEPDLRDIPSIIGGDPTRRTSIVLAKSVPAKKYGIVTGEPVSAALRKCPGLVIAPADFSLYSEMSHAFKAILREYTPVMEEFSIDECFLDMTGMELVYPDPVATAHEIKDRIRRELGFTVNVGISSNKLLAKMASDFEKPDKVHTLFPEEIERKMWPLPVGELFLCGKSSADKLSRLHIDTIGALAKSEQTSIKAILGNKAGTQLWNFANGIDDSPVTAEPDAPKGYSNEITFDDNIISWEQGNRVLLHLADNVAARVRRDGVKASCISVTIRGNDMKKHSHQRMLDTPTDGTSRTYEIARELFRQLWDGYTNLRLIELAMTQIDREGQQQLSFFDEITDEREQNVDKTVDVLRQKFGNDIIKRGSMIGSDIKVRKR